MAYRERKILNRSIKRQTPPDFLHRLFRDRLTAPSPLLAKPSHFPLGCKGSVTSLLPHIAAFQWRFGERLRELRSTASGFGYDLVILAERKERTLWISSELSE